MNQQILLTVIALGIWAIFLQNAGVIPVSNKVEVANTVSVVGVNEFGNVLDVNLLQVNGWPAANYYEYSLNGKEFHSLGVEYVAIDPAELEQ